MVWMWGRLLNPKSGQFFESSLNEMPIECQGGLDSHFLHRDEGGTVRQGIHFVGMIFKVLPGRIKQFLADMDDFHQRAAHEAVDDFDGFGVPVASVENRYRS
jgi:hypothetical protein